MSKKKRKSDMTAEERLYMASQMELMWRKFRKHKLAIAGLCVLAVLYTLALFCPFFAPYGRNQRHPGYVNCPPQGLHLVDMEGNFHWWPFVYEYEQRSNPETFAREYKPVPGKTHPVSFFVRGHEYKLFGILPMDRHFIGAKDGKLFLCGTDSMGRDLLSRILYGARISLTIGLIGVVLSLVLGTVAGGISGYYGGKADMLIQRLIEFILCIPAIPFWMALSAALPAHWSVIQVYFAITVILSLRRWCGIARVVRGKFLQLREEDFVMAARVAGCRESRIMFKHMVPSFMSYIIVRATIMIPGMIIAETALSFLGLGIRPPAVSWGSLLQETQSAQVVIMHPWILIPGLFVIAAVLAFNFVGDGLRDAADPYK